MDQVRRKSFFYFINKHLETLQDPSGTFKPSRGSWGGGGSGRGLYWAGPTHITSFPVLFSGGTCGRSLRLLVQLAQGAGPEGGQWARPVGGAGPAGPPARPGSWRLPPLDPPAPPVCTLRRRTCRSRGSGSGSRSLVLVLVQVLVHILVLVLTFAGSGSQCGGWRRAH